MDDTAGNKARQTNQRPGGKERRRVADRRSGLDRRGKGKAAPVTTEPRTFGFRDFDERRSRQDRRLYLHGDEAADDWGSDDRAANHPQAGAPRTQREVDEDGFIHLTHAELLQLLSEFDR
jgi:hypothetical protein